MSQFKLRLIAHRIAQGFNLFHQEDISSRIVWHNEDYTEHRQRNLTVAIKRTKSVHDTHSCALVHYIADVTVIVDIN